MAATAGTNSEIKEVDGIKTGGEDNKTMEKKPGTKDETQTQTKQTQEQDSEFEMIDKDSSSNEPVQTLTKPQAAVQTEEPRKNSLVTVAVIKEPNETSSSSSSDKDGLAAALEKMPGMTKSKSQEILKAIDEKEIKEIAENINENEKEKEAESGSLIDISVVEESDTEKDVQEVIKEADSGFQAEVVEDNEDIEIKPSENEEVIEYTIEMKHAIPIISVMMAFVAVFYALIFHYHV